MGQPLIYALIVLKLQKFKPGPMTCNDFLH